MSYLLKTPPQVILWRGSLYPSLIRVIWYANLQGLWMLYFLSLAVSPPPLQNSIYILPSLDLSCRMCFLCYKFSFINQFLCIYLPRETSRKTIPVLRRLLQ